MKRLGEILLEKGALSIGELHTALERCHRSEGRLGTQLLQLGFVDESTLLGALSEQFDVPSASEDELRRAGEDVRQLLPAARARHLRAVPVRRSGDVLRVAMANPGDPAAVEEIEEATGLKVEPAVATESAVELALAERTRETGQVGREADDVTSAAVPAARWEDLWRPPRLRPHELLEVVPRSLACEEPIRRATFPGLAPVAAGERVDDDLPLDSAAYRRELQEARHRDEVGELLLRYALGLLARVCLFAVHSGRIVGWLARGQSVVVEDLQTFSVGVSDRSLFTMVPRDADYWVGNVTTAQGYGEVSDALGEPAPEVAIVFPLRVKDKIAAFLLGDTPGDPNLALPVNELLKAVKAAALTLEVLILRKKIGG